jgi:hypothetical protein
VTLMSLGLEDVRGLADQGVAHDDIQGTSSAEQRMLNSWERQIAWHKKEREPACAAPQLCHTSSRARHRHQSHPGAAGARQARYHGALYPSRDRLIANIKSPLDLLGQRRRKPKKPQQKAQRTSETTSTDQPPA